LSVYIGAKRCALLLFHICGSFRRHIPFLPSPTTYLFRYTNAPNHIPITLRSLLLQIARAKEIKAHFLRKQAQETKDKRALAEKRANGVIVSLGLVNADEGSDEK